MGLFRFLAPLQRFSCHRWLMAIRNSLVLLLPVTVIGALAGLIGSCPLSALFPHLSTEFGGDVARFAMQISNASYGILAIVMLVLVSHSLALDARERGAAVLFPPLVVTVALVNFFVFTQMAEPLPGLPVLGTVSILPAILVAIFSVEVFVASLQFWQRPGRPQNYDLDPNLHFSARSIIPAFTTVVLFFLTAKGLSLLAFDLGAWLGAQLLLSNDVWGSQLPGLLVVGVLSQALWFVGLHGPHMLDSVYRIAFELQPGTGQVFEITSSLYNLYVNIGGSGATLGLLLAILFHVRQREARRVARFGLLPSLFNINEPIIYGLPIVLNPLYLIPFMLVPVVLTVVSYCCVHFGLVRLDVVPVPWMTPPLLGGVLNSGSWQGGALQLFNLLLSTLIYLPFIRLAEQHQQSENLNIVRRAVLGIEALKQQQRSVLDRHDELGHAARKLLHEFMQDIDAGASRVYLAYQPQHDRSGAVVGVEALLRWEHRLFGFISPAVICALAEESGQIKQIGRWAIATACRQLHDWKRSGVDSLRMSVNLSPIQLKDTSLLTAIAASLAANKLQSHELCLELTESQHVPDDPVSTATLEGLLAMGIHLEMDDFGMGYSSMLYVRRFKFSSIKLDGSLTKEVLQDNHCSDIICSVVQLGRALGIRVIAEYVETREQLQVLENLGCDVFQGYLYSPALAGERCADYLLASQRVAGPACTSAGAFPGSETPGDCLAVP